MANIFRANFSNRLQRSAGLAIGAADWLRLEKASALAGVWRTGQSDIFTSTGEICPARFEAMLSRIVNAPERADEFREFFEQCPVPVRELFARADARVRANLCRDYALSTRGFTDESDDEWNDFCAAIEDGAVKLFEPPVPETVRLAIN